MPMLFTPSLCVTRQVPQAGCSWSITQGINHPTAQGKALRGFLGPGSIWRRGSQVAGASSLRTAPGEDDTLSLCRRERAGQHPGDRDGERPASGWLPAGGVRVPAIPGGCSQLPARSGCALHEPGITCPPLLCFQGPCYRHGPRRRQKGAAEGHEGWHPQI